MNPVFKKQSILLLDRPLVGLTSPEFQKLMNDFVQAISQATKKRLQSLAVKIKSIIEFIRRKNLEGAELYERSRQARAALHERYAHQGFTIRSYL